MNLFLDMDDFAFNFSGHYLNKFGLRPEDEETKDDMWKRIAKEPRFFIEIPLLEGVGHFVRRYADSRTIWLTHVPENDFGLSFADIAAQKIQAVKQQGFPGTVIAVPRHISKAHYMQAPGDILVDDYRKNIEEWNALGGTGILHKDFLHTHAEMDWHLYIANNPQQQGVS